MLIQRLQTDFGIHDQDQSTICLDSFFDLRREPGRMSLSQYLADWRLLYDEAEELAGLSINNIGKTHLFLRQSGLNPTAVANFKLQINGDLNRFEDLFQIIGRFAKHEDQSYASSTPSLADIRVHMR